MIIGLLNKMTPVLIVSMLKNTYNRNTAFFLFIYIHIYNGIILLIFEFIVEIIRIKIISTNNTNYFYSLLNYLMPCENKI